jgi:Flp pilus assembly protein TadG
MNHLPANFAGQAPGRCSRVRKTGSFFRPGQRRSGAAVVELAVLLPLLVLLFIIAVDFARVYYFSLTLQNCARAGALYASDPWVADESPFASYQEAALSDATNITPAPTISKTNGTDAVGRPYVEVTAAHSFNTITGFPGVPNQVNLRRSVKMYIAAISPNPN